MRLFIYRDLYTNILNVTFHISLKHNILKPFFISTLMWITSVERPKH